MTDYVDAASQEVNVIAPTDTPSQTIREDAVHGQRGVRRGGQVGFSAREMEEM